MGFIKELYYGNISSGEQTIVSGSKYESLSKTSLELHEELRHTLDGEAVKKLNYLFDIDDKLTTIEIEENYALGFRDGARLMLDVLTGENSDLRPMIKE